MERNEDEDGNHLVHSTAQVPETDQSVEDFLITLFTELDTHHIRYCVLHSWEQLPRSLSSDLDIAVHPDDARKLPFVLRFLQKKGYIPIQLLSYAVNAQYFVFCWFQKLNSVAVDVIVEHRRGGLILASGQTLVTGRQKRGIFWIADPGTEFSYLLAKKACKGTVSAVQASRLELLVKELGRSTAERLASKLFLGTLGERVVDACAHGCLETLLSQIRNQTWRTSVARNPLRLAAYLLSDVVRRVRRFLQPTGLFVVVMGPDGAGKSSLIEHLVREVGPAFRRHKVFHWRPMLLWRHKAVGDTTQPHSRPPNSASRSVARLFVHLLDFWLGYWLLIRPVLVRSGFVLFDRYFHDVLADPKRYRFGGPGWLAKSVGWLVPKPDLLFILDAAPEVILSRKQEVMPADVLAQRQVYLQMGTRFSYSRVIDTAAPLSLVVEEAGEAVCEFLAQRFRRRNANWLDLGAQ